ncbi:flagellar hook assembly protein FlgD [methane-oxidizing endosymbiont of Gigantopelta aegis]|uniref:flagellar hook assembly protein FlgD n=1 Tax=methane-oxidizing endosymbiont of Gigantopelta aegis TaxID=2794938 RepID=UPI0018DE4395|nr:flagellar hook assembly protein FlgD [methane-oxidizing endosymbiont of Gigantopelta aegis]
MSIDALSQYKELGLATVDKNKPKEATLQQEQFLELMTTQLTHQDPLKPMDNGDFLGQMAQFSAVSGIQDLQKSFKDFADSVSSGQTLQAASLVGRYVAAPATEGLLAAGGTISGSVTLPESASSVVLKISDPTTGETIRTIDLGSQAQGDMAFSWDGVTDNNELANPGVYQVKVEAKIGKQNTVLQTHIKSKVESVSLNQGSQGLKVNLQGLGSVKFSQIKQIL